MVGLLLKLFLLPSLANNMSSWQKASQWYIKEVGLSGHYYHQHTILPNLLKLITPTDSVLDLACGQGVLSRHLKSNIYQGVDISPSLIKYAKEHAVSSNHRFAVGDVTKKLPINKTDFDIVAVILALQNIEKPELVIANAASHLKTGGQLIVVLNHPCFRIPRQSSWEIDEKNKLQYRRINRYLSPLKVPIETHPGQGSHSSLTWSFHHSLSDYSRFLNELGFVIIQLEEWVSDKESTGKVAKMENLSRTEFPLFLTILARKT
ncbi:MAG: hypothetical protein ACD_61C00109G0001 [uncultured bacterium]|nr:MAG: hypothetical protein ACD_61C00109G0001 [uncultured bacterium]